MTTRISTQAQFSAVTLLLTPSALLFLNGMTKGIPHLTIYIDLLFSMAITDSNFKKRGVDVSLKPLEVEASANGLGDKWNLGRKVMTRLLGEMEELGLLKPVKSTPQKLTSIATMSAVTDWLPIDNSNSNRPTDETSADHQRDELPQSGDTAPASAIGETLDNHSASDDSPSDEHLYDIEDTSTKQDSSEPMATSREHTYNNVRPLNSPGLFDSDEE